MKSEERSANLGTNILSITCILEEAELERKDHEQRTEWVAKSGTQTHLIGTTVYGIKRATVSPELGVLYCTTITTTGKRGARIYCLSRKDLETEVLLTPENILEREGLNFHSFAQAILAYERIHDQALQARKPFTEYLTSS